MNTTAAQQLHIAPVWASSFIKPNSATSLPAIYRRVARTNNDAVWRLPTPYCNFSAHHADSKAYWTKLKLQMAGL
ncbi:hypothetical protein WJX79_005405 [Trebouxia sp. C0005]